MLRTNPDKITGFNSFKRLRGLEYRNIQKPQAKGNGCDKIMLFIFFSQRICLRNFVRFIFVLFRERYLLKRHRAQKLVQVFKRLGT